MPDAIDISKLAILAETYPRNGSLQICPDAKLWICGACGQRGKTNIIKHLKGCSYIAHYKAVAYLDDLLRRRDA